jgi:hypothetical protein
MKQHIRTLAVVGGLLITVSAAAPAFAQKQGGILKLSHFDSPASMSILEESTRAALQPAMGIFNNLVMYKRTYRKPACNRSSPTSPPGGRGTRTGPN